MFHSQVRFRRPRFLLCVAHAAAAVYSRGVGVPSWTVTSTTWCPWTFFTVPTIRFQVLYVFLVLAHDRRRVLHFHVTAHPTADWTAQQLREAFPFDQVPCYLLRDRDQIFGDTFRAQVNNMQIKEVLSAPRPPWQRAYVERVIGSIRRECLDRPATRERGTVATPRTPADHRSLTVPLTPAQGRCWR
jgi:transposase InsO family protein